jgi:RES domain-containing protein
MILWRISRHLDLSGRGGIFFAGRWHHAGVPIVYLAETPAGALLETCVHTSSNDVPPSFTLLKIAGPDLAVNAIERSKQKLKRGWTARVEITRELGSDWLKQTREPLIRVPSALVPETFNYLLNPLHVDAVLFQIKDSFVFPFDARLKS